MIVGHIGGAGSPYEIQKSLRFRASASAYLSRTPGSVGNRKTWTWSGWVKRGSLSAFGFIGSSVATAISIGIEASNQGFITISGVGVGTTTAVFRDPSAWYHVVIAFDTTQATAANRVKFYVNNAQHALSNTLVSLNTDYNINSNVQQEIGTTGVTGGTTYLDGYLTEINFIDGQALTPSSFGEFSAETGAWIPKKYTGTYGTNGFYLPFNDGSNLTNLTADRSGNGNNWTANNISLTSGVTYDWVDDTPTNNYAVLNQLNNAASRHTISQGNLVASLGTAADDRMLHGTVFANTGKWYFEYVGTGGTSICSVGVASNNAVTSGGGVPQANSVIYFGNGAVYKNGASQGTFTSYANGDVIGVAFDLDALTVALYKNNTLITTITGLTSDYYSAGVFANNPGDNFAVNFGQRPFAYSPPAGFKALCTKNLPTPSITNPKRHFDVVLATGANIKSTVEALYSDQALMVVKDRANANNWQWFNDVTGLSAILQSNTTSAETTYSAPTGSSVGYGWKAGGAPVTNNAGSIQSQVSANPQAGFSIVTYTGTGANATVGHGLGVAPKMVIIKQRNGTGSWVTWHNSFSPSYRLDMETTNSLFGPYSTFMQDTVPSSSVVYLGTNGNYNAASSTYVAYCFAEIPGYSKIGRYTGNGSVDGPFVHCGFRPSFIFVKRTDTVGTWYMIDKSRNGYNSVQNLLYPNLANAESTINWDILSNGFKMRDSGADVNANGGTYIFAAFAEQPFKFANAR